MAQTGIIVGPYGNYNFYLEIKGITRAAFHEASGFESSIDVTEHREGGENITLRKLTGMVKYSKIILKWGITDDRELYDWHMQWGDGDAAAERKDGSIILYDRRCQEKVRWNFTRAWPCKWTGPSFTAEGNDVAIETLELAHEGIERA